MRDTAGETSQRSGSWVQETYRTFATLKEDLKFVKGIDATGRVATGETSPIYGNCVQETCRNFSTLEEDFHFFEIEMLLVPQTAGLKIGFRWIAAKSSICWGEVLQM